MSAVRRVLVTGASGFIGRWSVPALVEAGFEVHAVVSASHRGETPLQLEGASVHRTDLLDAAAVEELLTATTPSHLLHFAWIAQPGIYWHSSENFRWLAASEHLLQRFEAGGGHRAVMAGSCAEYLGSQHAPCDESASALADDAAAGTPAYTACKLRLHRALAAFSARHGVSSAWGRIFFQYGPFEHPRRLVPDVILSLLKHQEALCSHGRQVRSFLHAADVGGAFAALLDSSVEGAVNVGSDQSITIADLVGRIAEQIGASELIRLGARRAGPEPAMLVPVTARLRENTSWRPRFSLEQGLSDVIAWWRRELVRTHS